MEWWKNRPLVIGAVLVLAVGFGGGFLTAKAFQGGGAAAAHGGLLKAASGFASGFGKPRDAKAPRASRRPDGFAVWRQRIDTTTADPRVCVEFSRPLDPKASYGDFVLVSPDPGRPPAVTVVNGTELCLTGLGFYDRRVTFLKGLPGRGNDKLAANADVDFTFGEKPPFVGFAGEGVILPREESDGVPIETVNVSKLAVEVWRVPDRNLVRREIAAPSPTGDGEYPDDWGSDSPDQEGRVIWKGEIPVRAPQGRRATTVFPLGAVLKEMKPGAYVIKARDASGGRDLKKGDDEYDPNPPAQARRWVLFTDMALVSYRGAEGLDVVVRSLKTAKPMGSVRVALVSRNGEDLAEGSSDAQGRVHFARALLDGKGNEAPKMAMAYGPGADFTAMDLDRAPVDLSNQGVGGRPVEGAAALTAGRSASSVVDAYVYADRGVYRPGETVRLVALLRDAEAKAVKDRKGSLIVKRPSGVEAFRWRFEKTAEGFASANVVLPKSAPRGRWTATVEIEGLDEPAGKLNFSVEDFAPQRLAVDVAADASKPLRAADEERKIGVDARFLYGAPGAGLQVQGDARVKPDYDPFPAYKDFRWGDEQAPFEEKFLELGETVTDGGGDAALVFKAADVGDTAQPLKALLNASVFEPGGRPVREGAELKIRQREKFLGVKVDPGEANWRGTPTVTMDVIAVDPSGTRVAAPGTRWTLVSENWDYDWFQQDGRWQWRRTSRDVVVASGKIDVGAGGAAKLSRRLDFGDYRLLLEEPVSGARTVVRFAAGWGAPAKDAESPDMVRVSAGTKPHAQGDTVTVNIKAPYAGQAQVAVATDRILELRNIDVPAGGTSVKLKTSPAWGGGAYVLVSVVQPRDPVATPKPRRAIGLTYVSLDPKNRKLAVDLGAPAKARGRDQLVVPVKVKGLPFGQRARVTVAAVDQGILNLTKFQSPDPAKWYFGKRALGVDYRDDYGRLIDPNMGAAAALNYGADEIGGEGLTTTPIKTVALWSGVVETGLDGTAKVVLPAADFNGELRLMAVAWTDEAVGASEEKMTVREPVVAELALPRFLAPGDRAWATLELHNVEGKPGVYSAMIRGAKGILVNFQKAYQLLVGQRAVERVEVAAPSRAGVGGVTFDVSGQGFQYGRTYGLETRPGWGSETRVTSELQKPGEAWTPAAALLAGYQPGSASLQVSYSPFRGFDPAPIAAGLSRYPYGCTEQIVSAAYPWLYATQATADGKTAARADPLLSQAVGRLLDRQSADGAFGLWRAGDGEADAWLGAFATDFLVEARNRGAPVPQAALDKALSAMRQISRPEGWAPISYRTEYPTWWAGNEDASRDATKRMRSQASAYALYVMAKGGKGDLARLRWWHDVQFKSERSPLARAQIGAGLAMMGDKARARSAFKQAVSSLGYRAPDDWYQSPLRDLAGVVALAYEAGEKDLARDLQKRLDGAVKDPDALNTQEQARLLQAAHYMVRAAGVMRIEAGGVTQLTAAGGAQRWSVGKLADARFTNRGSGALWRTVTVRGAPAQAPGAINAGVTLQKSFFTMQGAGVDPSTLSQGDRVVIRVSGKNGQGRTVPLVIDDALPAGFEIETVLSPEDAKDGPFKFLGELSSANAQEMRDDRYVAAMSLPGSEPFAVAYVARAVTPGNFYLPGAEARDMYRASVFARTAGGRTAIGAGG
ncbi:alpha-2-macroglobulin [Caulobacter sp. 17J65-9]|uniref:alpha-2-macroglobulin family protein n=1 Tax=Caulobacter sp. 17J65-9 TaxID=2709382 RepID=UPI0013CA35C1|nr:alpha-2-macroglobulin [Caulobacter sp. 17J65-9]NEX94411.1 alpha-2-macroglobulin family protein [Caulobacter sp. 17J65-9]